tara:strand:+ start:2705 stop:3736 length:1032 start_codon:yes stop_codon:yes gene_type:complete
MSRFKFKKNEVVLNNIEAHPTKKFHISGSVFYDNDDTAGFKPNRFVSGSSLIVDKSDYDIRPHFVTQAEYTASYATASFSRDYYTSSNVGISSDLLTAGSEDKKLLALKNTLNHYKRNSLEHTFEGYSTKNTRLVSIPSLFYGSSIEKGSVDLKFYTEGTTVGRLQDIKKNGELIQTSTGTGSGSVAGVVLYNEGFVLLTGSWTIDSADAEADTWADFASTASFNSSSFDIDFRGTTHTPVMTMFAHANRNELNSSNNPTFVTSGSAKLTNTGSYFYVENAGQEIKNIVSSSYAETGSFEKTVYISSVGIYDDDNNLLGIAKLAEPIRKRERDSYTFKLKVDL